MRLQTVLIVLAAVMALSAQAQPAPDAGGDSAEGDEFLRLPPLGDFEAAAPIRTANGYRRLYRRPGDSPGRWTELIGVTSNRDWRSRAPIDVARSLAATYRATCGTLELRGMKPATDAGYPSVTLLMTCRDAKPGGSWFGLQDIRPLEFAAIKLIQGRESFYVIQRFWHSETETEPAPLADPATRRTWQTFAAQTRLCDRTRPEPACGTGTTSEALHFDRPARFAPGAPRLQGNMRVLELVPHGETLDDWTEMLTFTSETGVRDRDVKRHVQTLVDLQRRRCGELEATLSEVRREEGHAVIDFQTVCRAGPEGPAAGLRRLEFLRGKVIQGRDGFHTVQRAWHSDTATSPSPIGDGRLRAEWDAFLDSVDLCDRRRRDRPCKGALPVFQVSGGVVRDAPRR